VVVPDYGKPIHQLRAEWETCRACDLGPYRQDVGGAFVFGEGVPGAIMLVGEGPGETEEKEGRPFVGYSGEILRQVLSDLRMQSMVYITNCVCCRSCAQAYDSEGKPVVKGNGKPRIEDRSPGAQQVQACLPRLYEEVYLVDPVVVVPLGATAAEVLLKKPVAILSECGSVKTMRIPGAGYLPQFTEKKREWRHRIRKEWVAPVAQNQVEYLCIPCLHPAHVARNLEDRRPGAPPEQFVKALQLARDVYEKYMNEIFGEQVATT